MEQSSYLRSLSTTDHASYLQKLSSAGVSVDPYAVPKSKFNGDYEHYPCVTYLDMIDYFISSPNPDYNYKTMKCHKSLKAHNIFTSGWVKEVIVAPTTGLDAAGSSQSSPVIVRGRVIIYILFLSLLLK